MTDEHCPVRNVTIDSCLLKVVEDAYQVRREKGNLKFIKHEMLPPLTASFRQNRAIRQVDRVHGVLKKEIEKCDKNDGVRQQMLEAVGKKCDALKASFENSEGAISQLQKQKESHKQVMDNIIHEIKSRTMEIKRYFRAAEDLTSIRDIMQSVINENTCYLDFLEKVAAESKRYRSAREITGRYEKLLFVKKNLNERLDEALAKMEETKQQVLTDNAVQSSEQHYVLQKLQALDYELNLVKTKTIKYEMALNNISIESLEHMRILNLVLKSAEQMIENLIKEGVIEPGAIMDLHVPPAPSRESDDDWEDDEEEEDCDDLGRFGSHESSLEGSELVDMDKPEFIVPSQVNQYLSGSASTSSSQHSVSHSHVVESSSSFLSMPFAKRYTSHFDRFDRKYQKMANQQEEEISKRKTNIFMCKPQNAKRHLMADVRILDVIEDNKALQRDKNKGKFRKGESVPPMTASYRCNRDVREITRIEGLLNKEVTKCDKRDVEKKEYLKEVISKCEALKTQFLDSEAAYLQLTKDLSGHQEMLETEVRDQKEHKMALQRYLIAGESLMKIVEIMDDVISKNQCYYEFALHASGGDGVLAIGDFIDKFETHVSTRDTLSRNLSEAIKRVETIKTLLRQSKDNWELELAFDLEKLQGMQIQTASANAMNKKYEEALDNINNNSVDHQKDINGVLKSAEQMIENLIERKVLAPEYRKKTFAQQCEAIRSDYVKRKAILHEYEKIKSLVEQKKDRRVTLFDKYSKRALVTKTEDSRLGQLYEKKRMMVIKKKFADYLKLKHRSMVAESVEIDYDPLEDENNVVSLERGEEPDEDMDGDDADESEIDSGQLDIYNSEDHDLWTNVEEDIENCNSFLSLSDIDTRRPSSLSSSTIGSRKLSPSAFKSLEQSKRYPKWS
ncbi:hypothetical protein GE061_013392 [Apolygus lucorum]|uniref:DUF4200 domain-containing protein n=1 Tax=Apolygus lucorum TaxID=248454 RepID=A0A8S9XPX3_APOLU|nr:hypothetical protein GE061_013392 [Apolygus lucorum]